MTEVVVYGSLNPEDTERALKSFPSSVGDVNLASHKCWVPKANLKTIILQWKTLK
jgi:hypothetical protein